MEFMLDTINLEAIRKYQKILPLAGVTSNPSIVKQAGKIDFFAQMKEIKNDWTSEFARPSGRSNDRRDARRCPNHCTTIRPRNIH